MKREITTARRRLLSARRVIEKLLAPAPAYRKDLDPPGWDMLEELLRRGAEVKSDGYPQQSESDTHGGFGQQVGSSTSTERAALRLASEDAESAQANGRDVQPDNWTREDHDLVADLLRELVTDVSLLATYADNIDNCRRVLLSIEGKGRRSDAVEPMTKCPLCELTVTGIGEDRIKSGYCNACYIAWRAWGAPRDPVERSQFERARLAYLKAKAAESGAAPPPRAVGSGCEHGHFCCDRATDHTHWHPPATCPECARVRAAMKAS